MNPTTILRLFSIICIVLFSCTSTSNDKARDTTLEDSLSSSTKKLDIETDSVINLLDKKLSDTSLNTQEDVRLIYAQKIKSVTNDFKNQIDSSYHFSTGSNFEGLKATVIQKLNRYIDYIFQIHPEIWMAYRKEFPLLIEENVFANFHSTTDLKLFQAKTNNILSTVKNKAVMFCYQKMKL